MNETEQRQVGEWLPLAGDSEEVRRLRTVWAPYGGRPSAMTELLDIERRLREAMGQFLPQIRALLLRVLTLPYTERAGAISKAYQDGALPHARRAASRPRG